MSAGLLERCWRAPRLSSAASTPYGTSRPRAELRRGPTRPPARAPPGAPWVDLRPAQHALAFCNAQTRGERRDLPLLARRRAVPARSLRLALNPSQRSAARVLARALRAIQSESVCVLREATPTIAERYALCRGDLRVAVAAFDTLARCCYDRPEAGAAAARWLSSAHDYRPLPNIVSSAGMEAAANYFLSRRIGQSVINIFALRPLSVLEQFDEPTRPSTFHGLQFPRRRCSPPGHVLKWHVDRRRRRGCGAPDGPAAARLRVARATTQPLSEQLLALPAVAWRHPTRTPSRFAAAGASRPFLAQVAPALADQIRSVPPAQSKRIVEAGCLAPGPAASCPSRRYWTVQRKRPGRYDGESLRPRLVLRPARGAGARG